MSSFFLTLHIAVYCVAILVVMIGIIEKVSNHIVIGGVIGIAMLSVCRSSATGLICHLYYPELPLAVPPEDGGRGAATGIGVEQGQEQGQDDVELVVIPT